MKYAMGQLWGWVWGWVWGGHGAAVGWVVGQLWGWMWGGREAAVGQLWGWMWGWMWAGCETGCGAAVGRLWGRELGAPCCTMGSALWAGAAALRCRRGGRLLLGLLRLWGSIPQPHTLLWGVCCSMG